MTAKALFVFLMTTIGSAGDIDALLDRTLGKMDQAYSVDFDCVLEMSMGEMALVTEMTGRAHYRDPDHMRMPMRMEVGMEGQMKGGEAIYIADGTHLWVVGKEDGTDQTRVAKRALERAYENRASGPQPGDMPVATRQNPTAYIAVLKQVDLAETGREGARVTFEGNLKGKDFAELVGPPFNDVDASGKITVTADADKGFPIDVKIEVGMMTITVNYDNFADMTGKTFPEGTFTYVPEEGVAVQIIE